MEQVKLITQVIKACAKAYGIKGIEVINLEYGMLPPRVTKARATVIYILMEDLKLPFNIAGEALRMRKVGNAKDRFKTAKDRISKGGEFADRYNQALDYLALTASV